MLRDMCRNFADCELAPHAGDWDKDHTFPKDQVRTRGVKYFVRFNEAGVFGRLLALCSTRNITTLLLIELPAIVDVFNPHIPLAPSNVYPLTKQVSCIPAPTIYYYVRSIK